MKTEISCTFTTDTPFEKYSSLTDEIFNNTIQKVLSKKDWWGAEYIGFMIIAAESNLSTDKFYKPRRPFFKKEYTLKNPLKGDREVVGFCVIEYRFSEHAYSHITSSLHDKHELIRSELLEMIAKLEFLSRKCSEFDVNEFKKAFTEAINSVIQELQSQISPE